MPYNPSIHHRRSIRLKGYDYSQSGMYFITICCQDRKHRFGKIENGEMILNDFGKIAFDEWMKLPERYPNVILDAFQIMPNHVHGIIVLVNVTNGNGGDVGATLAVAPINAVAPVNRAEASPAPTEGSNPAPTEGSSPAPINPPTIGNIVGAYKSLVANNCLNAYKSRNEYMGKFWQRDYWDRIVRNENAYRYIANYIINNPANWKNDRFSL